MQLPCARWLDAVAHENKWRTETNSGEPCGTDGIPSCVLTNQTGAGMCAKWHTDLAYEIGMISRHEYAMGGGCYMEKGQLRHRPRWQPQLALA